MLTLDEQGNLKLMSERAEQWQSHLNKPAGLLFWFHSFEVLKFAGFP
jgi:hypothetical protein